jgi:hypothetical protein
MASPHMIPQHIDSTMRSAFVSCPQKYLLEFARGFRPNLVSIDLHAGAVFASTLETIYKDYYVAGRPTSECMVRGHAHFMTEWGDVEVPTYKRTAKNKERMWETVESYFTEYPIATDHVKPYFDVEQNPTFEYTFAIPLYPEDGFPLHPSGDPFLYTGRFDMLGSLNGVPCVRDEKTTGGSIGDNWADQWNLRAQFMGYIWACRQAGLEIDTVVVRGISILKTKITHVEAVKTYSDDLITKWYEQLKRDLWRLRRCYDDGYFDYNFGDGCGSYGGCIFQDVCRSPNPEPWLTNFAVRHWNPLNKNPIEDEGKELPQ